MARSITEATTIVSLSGILWERPVDVADALGDPRLSDCVLFDWHFHSKPYGAHVKDRWAKGRWEEKFVIDDAKGELRLLACNDAHHHEVKGTSSKIDYASAVLLEASVEIMSEPLSQRPAGAARGIEDDKLQYNIQRTEHVYELLHLPAHIFLSTDSPHMPPRAMLRYLSSLGIPLAPTSTHTLQMLLDDIAAAPAHHLHLRVQPTQVIQTDGVEHSAERPNWLAMIQLLVIALQRFPDSVVDGLALHILSSSLINDQNRRMLPPTLPLACHKLSHLSFLAMGDFAGVEVLDRLSTHATQFKFAGLKVPMPIISGVASTLQQPECRLSRLDLRWCSGEDGPCDFASVYSNNFLQALATNTSILDLGVDLSTANDMELILNSPAFPRLLILRLYTQTYDAVAAAQIELVLAEALTSPNCSIRFLDLDYVGRISSSTSASKFLGSSFWHALQENNASNLAKPLQALRICKPAWSVQVAGGLADYLSSPKCCLLWLDCRASTPGTVLDEKEEWDMAQSLIDNFSLCTMFQPHWQNPAAKAQVTSIIRRNLLYKSGQLLQEPQVKPSVAKLFLCGHGGAGKTTLCQALLLGSSTSLIPAYCGLLRRPSQTRGMEFHSLHFKENRLKLVICDLGGQEEFHTFHHYIMNSSNNDLFVVVCKLLEHHSQELFERQLRYWLKFIVSHKRAGSKAASTFLKPKVIVVVNFFYAASPEDMFSIAHEKAHQIMTDFSRELDFSSSSELVDMSSGRRHYDNLFGINVQKITQVQVVKRKLGALLEELLENGRLIPKLCRDIAEKVLPSLMHHTHAICSFSLVRKSKDTMFLPLATILEKYNEMFPSGTRTTSKQVQAAMMELHNQGVVLFFPKEGKSYSSDDLAIDMCNTLVITDSSWFCHKFIGDLLAVYLEQEDPATDPSVEGLSAWRIEDIRGMLRRQGCKNEYQLEEMVRYLEDLELCFVLEEHAHASQKKMVFLFPALVKEKEVQYPKVVLHTIHSQGSSDQSSHYTQEAFFGRRLKCEQTSVHLIPSGVFSRLQVRLRGLCENYNCYRLGYCWASFMKDNVGAVVRFGGDAIEPWENKEWIDILVFYPTICSHHADLQEFERSHNSRSQSAAENLMNQIKTVIYEMCQSVDCTGIPTVVLQEWMLQSKGPGPQAAQLTLIREQMKKHSLDACYVNWDDITIPATPVVDLLLPMELQEHVSSKLSALARIIAEFSLRIDDGSSPQTLGGVKDFDKVPPADQPQDDGVGRMADESKLAQLWRLILREELERYDYRQKGRFEIMNSQLDNINVILQTIRDDIHSLGKCLRQAERNIILNCSTRLLRHELTRDHVHPLYPYLVDAQTGKLGALKALLLVKKARLHFMCESPSAGPHPVQGQKGKKVTIETKEWLTNVARVMVPAFRVMCCLARIAATVYLPSAQVFIPSPDCLEALGICHDGLQQVILPKALEALLNEVPNLDYKDLLTQQGSMLNTSEVKQAIRGILKHDNIDMHSDFSLQRVSFSNFNNSSSTTGEEAHWVCEKHAFGGTPLKVIANPFK